MIHPTNNNVQSHQIVGRLKNPRLRDGSLIADMDIFDDLLSQEELIQLKNNQDVSMGYWYEMDADPVIPNMPIRKIKQINHVAIGLEHGVCSYPDCGLQVTAATDSKLTHAHEKFEVKLLSDPQKPLKQTTLSESGCDEAAYQKRIEELEKSLKAAQDTIATFQAQEKEKLIETLSKRLNVDKESLAQDSLEDLKKLDQRTVKVSKSGLVLTPDPKKQKASDSDKKDADDEDEQKGFELLPTGELPIKSDWNKGHDFYKGVSHK
jgi:hypothetical protein